MSKRNDGFHKLADFLSDYWPELLDIIPIILWSIWGGLFWELSSVWRWLMPFFSVTIMIVSRVFIFRKNKSIIAFEQRVEVQGRKIQEQESSLEKFGQENTALFNYVLYILSKNIGLTDTDRISVFKKTKDSFQTIGRYSLNPNYCEIHRSFIPISEGFIGKALVNGECVKILPEVSKKKSKKEKHYKEWVMGNCNIANNVLESIRMKSRFYYCKALTNPTGMERTSVIVVESTNAQRFTSDEIAEKLKPEEDKIQAFVEKCRFAPIVNMQIAKEEGF